MRTEVRVALQRHLYGVDFGCIRRFFRTTGTFYNAFTIQIINLYRINQCDNSNPAYRTMISEGASVHQAQLDNEADYVMAFSTPLDRPSL